MIDSHYRWAALLLLAAYSQPVLARAVASLPYPTLSATGLYLDVTTKKVAEENLPYQPQYPLWSDGSEKTRWVYLPPGSQIQSGKNATSSASKGNFDHWVFPVGTKFWKEFTFQDPTSGKSTRVETSLTEKTAEGQWRFTTYAWNPDETEAYLVPEEGKTEAYVRSDGLTHDIPSQAACIRCHHRGGDAVLGFDALQLSSDRDPMSPHARSVTADDLSFRKLVDRGMLSYVPAYLKASEPRVGARNPVERAALGYLHGNCSGCHNPHGSASHSYLILKQSSGKPTASIAPTIRSAIDRVSKQVLSDEDQPARIIHPGKPELSALITLMREEPEFRMPPLGNKQVDEAAVALIENWIRGLATEQ